MINFTRQSLCWAFLLVSESWAFAELMDWLRCSVLNCSFIHFMWCWLARAQHYRCQHKLLCATKSAVKIRSPKWQLTNNKGLQIQIFSWVQCCNVCLQAAEREACFWFSFLSEVWTCLAWMLADRGILYRLCNMTVQLEPVTTRRAFNPRLDWVLRWGSGLHISQSIKVMQTSFNFRVSLLTQRPCCISHTYISMKSIVRCSNIHLLGLISVLDTMVLFIGEVL